MFYRIGNKEYNQEELEKADGITQSCIFMGSKESGISYRQCLNELETYKKLYQNEKSHTDTLKRSNLKKEGIYNEKNFNYIWNSSINNVVYNNMFCNY